MLFNRAAVFATIVGMKQQVVYIHGGESFKNHDDFLRRLQTQELWHMKESETGKKWTGRLADDLGDDYEAIMPPMPNKQNAKYEEWSIWFERHFPYLQDGVILIGCSLGAMFLGKYLSENELPFTPGAVVLMAGLWRVSDVPAALYKDCEDFLVTPATVATIAKTYKNIIIMHSEDDFVVPFSHGEALAAAMPQAEFITFEDKNHFLVEEFPELVERIKAVA